MTTMGQGRQDGTDRRRRRVAGVLRKAAQNGSPISVCGITPFVRHHVHMVGRYPFQLPALSGGLRPPRDPDTAEQE
ncbi:hypothetical protein ACFXPI_36405 [Streptomyces sp. NPDC059104]|uniref:hypothetical protein n=1 Tax=Streptomyces sp. NPDC059104 TaxID=3346729 RepID=UPI0036ADB4E5